jgi:hypothetical protein
MLELYVSLEFVHREPKASIVACSDVVGYEVTVNSTVGVVVVVGAFVNVIILDGVGSFSVIDGLLDTCVLEQDTNKTIKKIVVRKLLRRCLALFDVISSSIQTPTIFLSMTLALHSSCICTAIGTYDIVYRNWERQKRAAFLAGDGLAVHVNRKAAGFAHHLLCARERFDVRAATAAVTLFAFMRLYFIIF